MGDKAGLEAFRHKQFAGAKPAKDAHAGSSSDVLEQLPDGVRADQTRAIIHFDVDCFYAQVEELREPSRAALPLAVTQKYLVVTCNYPARARGVTKLMGIQDALLKCPELHLVNGEDLTPYRKASKAIWAQLREFGTVQRGGLDEAFLDASDEVRRRIAAGRAAPGWRGHVWRGSEVLRRDNAHRPQDLRVVATGAGARAVPVTCASLEIGTGGSCSDSEGEAAGEESEPQAWLQLLQVASQVAQEARGRIRSGAGVRTSAGVACNKLLAKLASGLHKPDDQTIMLPPAAAAFVAPLPARALPGVGYKIDSQLALHGLETVAALRAAPQTLLEGAVGATTAALLRQLAWGRDPGEVVESGPPKALTCEDSFKSCSSFEALLSVVRVIVPDLVARVQEEYGDSGRWPRTLSVKWRRRGSGFHRSSASAQLPPEFRAGRAASELEGHAVELAITVLRGNLAPPFDLSLLNLGVTNLQELGPPPGTAPLTELFGASTRAGPRRDAGAECGGGHHGLLPQGGPSRSAHELCLARRDYGSAGLPGAVSKRAERALAEAAASGRVERSAPLMACFPAATAVPAAAQNALAATTGVTPGGDSSGAVCAGGETGRTARGAPRLAQVTSEPGGLVHADVHGTGRRGREGSGSEPPRAEAGPADTRRSTEEGEAGLVATGALLEPCKIGAPRSVRSAPLAGSAAQGAPGDGLASGACQGGDAARCLESSGRGPGGNGQGGAAVVLHVDVDCFYCQVEALDAPALRGRPVAVEQFNGGGFVSVSYEAKAAGIRKGDGAGAGGRANVPHLREMGALSGAEARAKCPGLAILPMRPDRYRVVARNLHAALRALAPAAAVEKASYDDFYLDAARTTVAAASSAAGSAAADASAVSATATVSASGIPNAPPASLRVVTDPSAGTPNARQRAPAPETRGAAEWPEGLARDLADACLLARRIQDVVWRDLGLSVSVGVGRTRLLARLLSSLHRPAAITVVPDALAPAFLALRPLTCIPGLMGKAGRAAAEALGAATVGDLRRLPSAEIALRAPARITALLQRLHSGGVEEAVQERGPPKSILAERSGPPARSMAELAAATAPLATTLWQRLVEDAAEHRRMPSRLVAHWRHGHGNSEQRSKSQVMPHRTTATLRKLLMGLDGGAVPAAHSSGSPGSQSSPSQALSACGVTPAESEAALDAIATAAITQICAYAKQPLLITRVAVSAAFDVEAAGDAAGQRRLHAFLASPGRSRGAASPAATGSEPLAALREDKQRAGGHSPALRRDGERGGGCQHSEATWPSAHAVPQAAAAAQGPHGAGPRGLGEGWLEGPGGPAGTSPERARAPPGALEVSECEGARRTGGTPPGGAPAPRRGGAREEPLDVDRRLALALHEEELRQASGAPRGLSAPRPGHHGQATTTRPAPLPGHPGGRAAARKGAALVRRARPGGPMDAFLVHKRPRAS